MRFYFSKALGVYDVDGEELRNNRKIFKKSEESQPDYFLHYNDFGIQEVRGCVSAHFVRPPR